MLADRDDLPRWEPVPADTWKIGEDRVALDSRISAWQSIKERAEEAADTFVKVYKGAPILDVQLEDWTGDTAEAFDEHRRKLVKDFDDCATEAAAVAGVLEDLRDLSFDNHIRLQSIFEHLPLKAGDGLESWWVVTPEDLDLLETAKKDAQRIKDEHKGELERLAGRLSVDPWHRIAARWAMMSPASQQIPPFYRTYPFEAPPNPSGTYSIYERRGDPGGRDHWTITTDAPIHDMEIVPSEETHTRGNPDAHYPKSYTVKFHDREYTIRWGSEVVIYANGQPYTLALTSLTEESYERLYGTTDGYQAGEIREAYDPGY